MSLVSYWNFFLHDMQLAQHDNEALHDLPSSLHNLGNTYLRMGKHEKAHGMYIIVYSVFIQKWLARLVR